MCQSNYITIRYNTLYIKYRNLTKKNPLPIRDSGVLAHYSTSELRMYTSCYNKCNIGHFLLHTSFICI